MRGKGLKLFKGVEKGSKIVKNFKNCKNYSKNSKKSKMLSKSHENLFSGLKI